MTPVHQRVAELLSEVIAERGQPLRTIPIYQSAIVRLTSGTKDYTLTTLIEAASALGYDVVINLREQR